MLPLCPLAVQTHRLTLITFQTVRSCDRPDGSTFTSSFFTRDWSSHSASSLICTSITPGSFSPPLILTPAQLDSQHATGKDVPVHRPCHGRGSGRRCSPDSAGKRVALCLNCKPTQRSDLLVMTNAVTLLRVFLSLYPPSSSLDLPFLCCSFTPAFSCMPSRRPLLFRVSRHWLRVSARWNIRGPHWASSDQSEPWPALLVLFLHPQVRSFASFCNPVELSLKITNFRPAASQFSGK